MLDFFTPLDAQKSVPSDTTLIGVHKSVRSRLIRSLRIDHKQWVGQLERLRPLTVAAVYRQIYGTGSRNRV